MESKVKVLVKDTLILLLLLTMLHVLTRLAPNTSINVAQIVVILAGAFQIQKIVKKCWK